MPRRGFLCGLCGNPAPPTPPCEQMNRRRLAGATHATFSVEKAATGLLRILSRLFSRPGLAAPLSLGLPWLMPPHLSPWLFESLAGHVSSAMRRLVATALAGGGGGNSDGDRGQGAVGAGAWRAVLSVLDACAGVSGGSRAEADAFEAVCLLVHNHDLKVNDHEGGWPGEGDAEGGEGYAAIAMQAVAAVRPRVRRARVLANPR